MFILITIFIDLYAYILRAEEKLNNKHRTLIQKNKKKLYNFTEIEF